MVCTGGGRCYTDCQVYLIVHILTFESVTIYGMCRLHVDVSPSTIADPRWLNFSCITLYLICVIIFFLLRIRKEESWIWKLIDFAREKRNGINTSNFTKFMISLKTEFERLVIFPVIITQFSIYIIVVINFYFIFYLQIN